MTAQKKALIIFGISVLVVGGILFLIPINLFDGVIHYNVDGLEFTRETRLSLSYFIGIGASPEQLVDVTDFYLTKGGLMLAFIAVIGLPALIAYRFYLKGIKK